MSTKANANLQFKLSVDPGLYEVWEYLKKEYKGLDKTAIIRLALNSLFKEAKQSRYKLSTIDEVLSELDQTAQGMSEQEVYAWWNKNKPV